MANIVYIRNDCNLFFFFFRKVIHNKVRNFIHKVKKLITCILIIANKYKIIGR